MGKNDLEFVAGGGLIARRSFLKSGLASSAVLTAALTSRGARGEPTIGDGLPLWMKSPGGGDVAYGLPSTREGEVVRLRLPVPPETQIMSAWHSPVQHQQGIITPSGLHFSTHHNGIPDIDPQKHQLMIHGLVEHPLRFDIERLLRYPMVSRIQFLECAGNTGANAVLPSPPNADCQELFGQMSCSEWTGVPLSILLREAGVKDTGTWVVAEGADGGSHARSLPLSKLMDDCLIALYQNGERLRPSQGYPMRLWVPGWEGNVNVKWVHRLEVVDQPAYTKDESGLYTQFLADDRILRFSFPMGVKSVITRPSGGQVLPELKGYYDISGFAWSGEGRIARVEVSADGGKTWANATLDEPVLDKAFTRFSIPWHWNGKSTMLLSRSIDEKNNAQPTRREWKKRFAMHSFNHYNAIQAWKVLADGRIENAHA